MGKYEYQKCDHCNGSGNEPGSASTKLCIVCGGSGKK